MDIIKIVSEPCNNPSCLNEEFGCDCGDSYYITVNGKSGYGIGNWVMDDKGNESIAFKAFGLEFDAKSKEDAKKHLKLYFSAFNCVSIECLP